MDYLEGAVIGTRVEIGEEAKIGRCTWISRLAVIGNKSQIGDGVVIGRGVRIPHDEKYLSTPLHIQGSQHLICVKHETIQIGCLDYPLEYWLDYGRVIGEREGYSPAEIEEYAEHLSYIQSLTERNII